MISGIGVDIVSVERLEKIANQWRDHFLTKIFTPAEIKTCLSRNGRAAFEAFAARFAAKEACKKALTAAGKEIPLDWKDVSVRNDPSGVPALQFSDRICAVMADFHWQLSLSHEREYAVAFVVCEKISRK